jgi:hypothetical protein
MRMGEGLTPKSSSCDGLRMADALFEKLCASSGILVPLRQYARSRTIRLHSWMSPFLNWSLCLTKAEERLGPRSGVCACLTRHTSISSDSGFPIHGTRTASTSVRLPSTIRRGGRRRSGYSGCLRRAGAGGLIGRGLIGVRDAGTKCKSRLSLARGRFVRQLLFMRCRR